MPALMVFSHPNHEIAVLGTIRRLQPDVIFLTDGGGEKRMDQSRAGLSDYLPPEKLTFLNHTEQSLYDGLLDNNVDFYKALSAQVAEKIHQLKPDAIYCDTVEFYNPVHDMALPVVRRAMNGSTAALYEVPLVYQKTGLKEEFEMQRIPQSLHEQTITVDLSADERDQKIKTIKSGVYGMLFQQLGTAIQGAIPTHAGKEWFLKGRRDLPSPTPEQILRYDHRGKTLEQAGEIKRSITYTQHYAPLFNALCGNS